MERHQKQRARGALHPVTNEMLALKKQVNKHGVMKKNKKSKNGCKPEYIGAGVALGVGVGVAIGVAIDNIAVGVGVGIGIGSALGAALGVGLSGRSNTRDDIQ